MGRGHMSEQTFDLETEKFIETPKDMKAFFDDIQTVCQHYGVSISHEDTHGSFVIESYSEKT
jgi:hypothetical protein